MYFTYLVNLDNIILQHSKGKGPGFDGVGAWRARQAIAKKTSFAAIKRLRRNCAGFLP